MRNEHEHQVVICDTNGKRLVVLDYLAGDNWLKTGENMADVWMHTNRKLKASSHVANGVVIVWVGLQKSATFDDIARRVIQKRSTPRLGWFDFCSDSWDMRYSRAIAHRIHARINGIRITMRQALDN